MSYLHAAALLLIAASTTAFAQQRWSVALHGGTSMAERASMDADSEALYRAGLTRALETAANVLDQGGTALDAVEQAILLLEDDPAFNAGRGAVFNSEGVNELDASIMDGETLNAGAVAGVHRTRHPVSLARAVMEKSRHVMLMGDGADAFAASQGLEQVAPSFFFTEHRWGDLLQQLEDEGLPSPSRPEGAPPPPGEPTARRGDAAAHEFGTVGVVALDLNGNLAAATSTGGTGVKLPGRVGDSPIIGAGTYASNSSCAVSSTGVGEFFIRLTIAREICALVEYRGLGLQQAADEIIQKRLASLGGSGGVIAVQPDGQTAWSFNTTSMLRARQSQGEPPQVHIYGDEP